MKEIEFRWYGTALSSELNEVKVIVISDLHLGSCYCATDYFQRTVDFIKNHNDCYCFLNGDMCESTIRTSKGEIYKQIGSPDDQRDWVIEHLLPIKDKVLGVTTGNHENRIWDIAGIDISQSIARELGVPYRPEGMLFKLSFGDGNKNIKGRPYVFWGYITHGYGGARTKASKAIKVERMAQWIHADFYAQSHDHVVNVAPNVYLMPDNRGMIDKSGFLSGKISAHTEKLIKTNAYLRWGGYSEMFGFPPSDLATPLIRLVTPKSDFWKDDPNKPRQAVKVVV